MLRHSTHTLVMTWADVCERLRINVNEMCRRLDRIEANAGWTLVDAIATSNDEPNMSVPEWVELEQKLHGSVQGPRYSACRRHIQTLSLMASHQGIPKASRDIFQQRAKIYALDMADHHLTQVAVNVHEVAIYAKPKGADWCEMVDRHAKGDRAALSAALATADQPLWKSLFTD